MTILKLLAGEDQALLVWRDALLVLNPGLNIVDVVGRLDLKGDGFVHEGLDDDLPSTVEAEDQVGSRHLLDIVAGEGVAIFELLASKDEMCWSGGERC